MPIDRIKESVHVQIENSSLQENGMSSEWYKALADEERKERTYRRVLCVGGGGVRIRRRR